MKEVTSTHNQTYKNLKQLAKSSKHRYRTKKTLLEGIHLCESYLQFNNSPELLVYTDSALLDTEARKIFTKCDELGVQRVLLGESNFKSISSVENGIGLMFVINIPTNKTPREIKDKTLLLEDIQDPGNVGSILRTAAAAGITDIMLSSECASAWSPKSLRAAMGAHFTLNIYEKCNLYKAIEGAQIQVLATNLNASATIYETDLSKPTAWLFGNEGQGVSPELLGLDVASVIIPQNPNVESLNVAASAAVCLFEQKRQSSIDQ